MVEVEDREESDCRMQSQLLLCDEIRRRTPRPAGGQNRISALKSSEAAAVELLGRFPRYEDLVRESVSEAHHSPVEPVSVQVRSTVAVRLTAQKSSDPAVGIARVEKTPLPVASAWHDIQSLNPNRVDRSDTSGVDDVSSLSRTADDGRRQGDCGSQHRPRPDIPHLPQVGSPQSPLAPRSASKLRSLERPLCAQVRRRAHREPR
jgi:hypothetical protein